MLGPHPQPSPAQAPGGRTRVELYRQAHVDHAARQVARDALHARAARTFPSRRARKEIRTPALRDFVRHMLSELEISDLDQYVETVLGSHPHDVLLAAMAVYKGKRAVGTLPAGADGHYLLVEERYWLALVASLIRQCPDRQDTLYRRAARRIHASARVPYRRQLATVRALADTVVAWHDPACCDEIARAEFRDLRSQPLDARI